MPENTKIATCSYCGTRTALVFEGKERHELICSACAAPLKEMEPLLKRPSAPIQPALAMPVAPKSRAKAENDDDDDDDDDDDRRESKRRRKSKSKKKQRKSPLKRLFDKIEDAVDDIFD